MQGCHIRCRGPGFGQTDSLERQAQDPDCWEEDEYQVVDQPTPGIPVYVVKSIAGCRPRVLHRNLLLPLQGRLRQEGATGNGGNPDSDSEGEAPEPPQAPCGSLGGPDM